MNPIIYTNISDEEYMFKEFSDTYLHVCFPEKNKQIVFDGNKYYSSHLSNDFVLIINVWDVFPMSITYFDNIICDYLLYKDTQNAIFNSNKTIINKKSDPIVQLHPDISDITVIGSWGIITEKFLEKIIYSKTNDISIYDNLFKLINSTASDILFRQNTINEIEQLETLSAIEEINKNNTFQKSQNIQKRININEDKFIQRLIIYNKFQKELCDWIVRESEKYALENNAWVVQNNIHILQVEKITSIFSFILDSFNESINNICESYSLNKDKHVFHIEDIYISKLDSTLKNENNSLFYTKHNNDIVLYIALNDEFENGGILFNDTITTHLKKGNMLIFNGNTKYSINNISSGVKYNLIAHINIMEDI